MTRALVTQLVEALEKLSDTEQTYAALDKADAAIEAAREYLATEPSGERAELIEQIDALFTDITPLPWFGAADGRGVGLSASRWTKNGGFADVTKDSVLRYGGSPITNTHFLAKLANSWPTIRDMLEADAQQATPDIKALQAKGKGPAPCARFCEANAFQIEIRRLTAEINAQQAKRVPMTDDEIDGAWNLYVSEMHFTHHDLVRFVEAHHGITPADKPTGWDNGLSQDYCAEFGQWLASRPGARQQIKEMFEPDAPK